MVQPTQSSGFFLFSNTMIMIKRSLLIMMRNFTALCITETKSRYFLVNLLYLNLETTIKNGILLSMKSLKIKREYPSITNAPFGPRIKAY